MLANTPSEKLVGIIMLKWNRYHINTSFSLVMGSQKGGHSISLRLTSRRVVTVKIVRCMCHSKRQGEVLTEHFEKRFSEWLHDRDIYKTCWKKVTHSISVLQMSSSSSIFIITNHLDRDIPKKKHDKPSIAIWCNVLYFCTKENKLRNYFKGTILYKNKNRW